jgi:hypothetical protein
MKEWSGSIRTALVILAIALITLRYTLYIEGWIAALLFAIGGFVFLMLAAVLITWTFIIIRTREFTKKNILAILFGVTAILISLYEPIALIAEGLKSRIVLWGQCEHTITNVFVVLREDGTFEYNAGAFLKKEEYDGEYKITGDSLLLRYNDSTRTDLPVKMIYKKVAGQNKWLICSGDTTKHRHHFTLKMNER